MMLYWRLEKIRANLAAFSGAWMCSRIEDRRTSPALYVPEFLPPCFYGKFGKGVTFPSGCG